MRLAFVHIPKTAGASVKDWFNDNAPGTLIHNGHRPLKYWQVEKNYNYSFTVIRNTYQRLISAYEYTLQRSQIKYNKRMSKGHIQRAESVKRIMEKLNDGIIPWLQDLILLDNNFIWPLSIWTENVDIILNQETLSEDFIKIQNLVGNYTELNKTKHVLSYNSNKHMTDRYIDFVSKHFAEEIEKFNFKPY